MFEVEQKFRVRDLQATCEQMASIGAEEHPPQQHRDTYYNHPCRDFAETREALRVRRVDGIPMVTYKGTVLPGDIKARRELEWRLDPGDRDGTQTEELLVLLGFRKVAVVAKSRRMFTCQDELADFNIVVDDVESLGGFVEIELIANNSGQIEAARQRIRQLSERLHLDHPESRSYLTMVLELTRTNSV